MTLDILVKISKIATPFIILFVGFWLNRSVQRHSLNMKLTSEFNTRWSEEFINRCQSYSQSISDIQFLMNDIGTKGSMVQDKIKQYNVVLEQAAQQKYHIETHSSLVDNADEIIHVIEAIFKYTQSNADALRNGGYADFDKIKNLQNTLNKHLKAKQKTVLQLS